jgi:hypothetical protein
MRWLAASIVFAALVLSYAISMPFRDCVAGYVTQAKSDDDTTRALAAMTCQVRRG